MWVLFSRLHCFLATSIGNPSERNRRGLQVPFDTKGESCHWFIFLVLLATLLPRRGPGSWKENEWVGYFISTPECQREQGKGTSPGAPFLCFLRARSPSPRLQQWSLLHHLFSVGCQGNAETQWENTALTQYFSLYGSLMDFITLLLLLSKIIETHSLPHGMKRPW